METFSPLPSLNELKKDRKPIRNINIEHRQSLSALEEIAVWVTDRIGSMGFFLVLLGWTFFWLSWNIFAPNDLRFDPYPAFVLWLIISNMIQILLMPLIMVGQNLQDKHLELRAETEFEVNLQVEREVETILAHLEHQNEVLGKIVQRIENK